MEVHSHTHTPRKKWTHYLWEFLMLFLAVFCGFLAENFREHYVEHKRARDFARQMYEDLKLDTVQFNWAKTSVEEYVKSFDTVNVLFDQTPPVSNQRLIRAVLPRRTTFSIPVAATTFSQMKSSGSLRFFNNDLSHKLSFYYDALTPKLLQSLEYNDNFFTTSIQPFMLDHFNYNESDFWTDTLKVNKPIYLERSSETDLLLRNRLILYNSLLDFSIKYFLISSQQKAIELMELLKKEYHLK